MQDHEEIELGISDTGVKRIHAGLSWDSLYSGKDTSLSRNEIRFSRFRNFPVLNTLIVFLLFNFLAGAGYITLNSRIGNEFDPAHLFISLVIASVLFLILLIYFMRAPNLMFYSGKSMDSKGRDRGFGHFDVDLHCFVFDSDKDFLFEISPKNDKLLSPDSSIYHSAEDTDGLGVYDDETIHFETAKFPENYAYSVLCVSNDCKYEFDKITNLKIRLADSASDANFTAEALISGEADGYVFGIITKRDNKFIFRKIGKYIPFDENWQNRIREFLA